MMKQVEVQAVITAGGFTRGQRYRASWDDARVAALVGAGYLHVTQVIEVDDGVDHSAAAVVDVDGDLGVGVVGEPTSAKKVKRVKGRTEQASGVVDSSEGGDPVGAQNGEGSP